MSKDAPNTSLVGTWRLVSFMRADGNGGARPYWDEQPSGLLVYTADDRVSAQLYDRRRPRLGVVWEHVSAAAAQVAFRGMASYFGTYRLDAARETVTHIVEGAMSPDWIGATLVRGYRFLAPNRLELRVRTSADHHEADAVVLVWDRLTK